MNKIDEIQINDRAAAISSKTISALCAPSLGQNTGMITVDMALSSVVERYCSDMVYKLNRFNVEKSYELASKRKECVISYNLLDNIEKIEDSDLIFVWGDFLTSRRYHRTGMKVRLWRAHGEALYEKATQAASDLLLLKNSRDDTLRRTICVGGTIYLNTNNDEIDLSYKESVGRLYKNSRLVLKRDPISACFATRLSGRSDNLIGVDCAFFLKPYSTLDWKIPLGGRTSPIGYSFGRGPSENASTLEAMQGLVNDVAEATGRTTRDIAWLSQKKSDPIGNVVQKLKTIRSCSFIITDTYHCAINAWREGVPAFCIGHGSERPKTALSDKKKELLYNMFNIREFYIFTENFSSYDGKKKVFDSIMRHSSSQRLARASVDRINDLVSITESRLGEEMRRILGEARAASDQVGSYAS